MFQIDFNSNKRTVLLFSFKQKIYFLNIHLIKTALHRERPYQICKHAALTYGICVGNYTGENTNNHTLIAVQKLGLFRNSKSIKVLEETLVLSELNEMDPPKHGDFIFHLLPHRESTMT